MAELFLLVVMITLIVIASSLNSVSQKLDVMTSYLKKNAQATSRNDQIADLMDLQKTDLLDESMDLVADSFMGEEIDDSSVWQKILTNESFAVNSLSTPKKEITSPAIHAESLEELSQVSYVGEETTDVAWDVEPEEKPVEIADNSMYDHVQPRMKVEQNPFAVWVRTNWLLKSWMMLLFIGFLLFVWTSFLNVHDVVKVIVWLVAWWWMVVLWHRCEKNPIYRDISILSIILWIWIYLTATMVWYYSYGLMPIVVAFVLMLWVLFYGSWFAYNRNDINMARATVVFAIIIPVLANLLDNTTFISLYYLVLSWSVGRLISQRGWHHLWIMIQWALLILILGSFMWGNTFPLWFGIVFFAFYTVIDLKLMANTDSSYSYDIVSPVLTTIITVLIIESQYDFLGRHMVALLIVLLALVSYLLAYAVYIRVGKKRILYTYTFIWIILLFLWTVQWLADQTSLFVAMISAEILFMVTLLKTMKISQEKVNNGSLLLAVPYIMTLVSIGEIYMGDTSMSNYVNLSTMVIVSWVMTAIMNGIPGYHKDAEMNAWSVGYRFIAILISVVFIHSLSVAAGGAGSFTAQIRWYIVMTVCSLALFYLPVLNRYKELWKLWLAWIALTFLRIMVVDFWLMGIEGKTAVLFLVWIIVIIAAVWATGYKGKKLAREAEKKENWKEIEKPVEIE